ncbi:MAG: von Willebrand factor type A domain-containing protein [Bacteroidales bacterium]|nr:von Willebrand factor type A domain-containing protein [Bacteroidales bacterium]
MKPITSIIIISILSVFLMSATQARKITGTVIANDGKVLQGVTVTEKGTMNSVYTDQFGKYSIYIASDTSVLVFSLNGMKTQEITVDSAIIIHVQMAPAKHEIHFVEDERAARESALSNIVSGNNTKPGYQPGQGKKAMAYDAAYVSGGHFMPQQDWNTESYSTIHENGFKNVVFAPLSTFSIDVDRASYSNVRRFVNMGKIPPVDAVRIEEMINYFSYDYPQPGNEHPFSVSTELSECPWNKTHQLLHVGLQGKEINKENLPPSNLVFLLDVSGSMRTPNKLPLLKSAFRLLVNELRPEDRVAIVVYAGAAGVVLKSTPGKEKSGILSSLDSLQAGGSTAGGEGIKLAYKIAGDNFIEGGNNRIILATDGDFNIGQSSDAEMERLIETKRNEGVFITVLGFGMGNYKDSKMETIADKGNGNYAYIDNIQEANKVLVSEFGGTLYTIAKDVKFQIEFNPARVKAYRLVGYENRLLNDEDFNDDTKDAGEMGAGHTVTVLYELIPAGSGEETVDIDPLKYQPHDSEVDGIHEKYSNELLTIKVRYKLPDEDNSIKMEIPIQGKATKFEKTTDNFRFSAAVAEFGMILRNSSYLHEGSIEDVLAIARNARGSDDEGYRGEFIRLVGTSKSLLTARQ